MATRKIGTSAALAAAFIAAFSGCAHSSRITTEPEGADLYVNGIPVGSTPVTYRYRSGLQESIYLRIEKPGFESLKDVTIDKVYRADVSLLLILAAIVPYFFSARLEDQYVFPLKPKANGETPSATDSGAAAPAGDGR